MNGEPVEWGVLPLSKTTVVLANTLSYVRQSLQSQLPWPAFFGQIRQGFFGTLLGPVPADGIVNSAVLVRLGAHWPRFGPGFVFRSINADYAFTFGFTPFDFHILV